MTETAPTLRADARRNREKLLHAAAAAFASGGPDASLEAIAKNAGVGIGTLYRHFPTRDDLIQATYQEEIDQLCAAAPALLETLPPDEALAQWFERYVSFGMTKRGMAGAQRSVSSTRRRYLDALTLLLDAGARAGTIRADVDAEDVLRASHAIWAIDHGPQWPEQARTILRLLLDGLRYRG